MNLPAYETTRRHRALGVTSFVVSLLATVILFFGFAAAAYLKVTGEITPGRNIVVGFVLFLGWMLELVAAGLGIAGLFDKSSKKGFPIAGLAIGLSVLVTSIAMIMIGIAKARGEFP